MKASTSSLRLLVPAALAIGSAPGGYLASPEIADRMAALRAYFQRQHGTASLLNQLHGLWAACRASSLTGSAVPPATVRSRRSRPTADGARWRWVATREVDGSESDTRTDGYATAVATLALQSAGVPGTDARLVKGLSTTCGTHRTAPAAGGWPCRPTSSVTRSRIRGSS